jgi:hypothetical protein
MNEIGIIQYLIFGNQRRIYHKPLLLQDYISSLRMACANRIGEMTPIYDFDLVKTGDEMELRAVRKNRDGRENITPDQFAVGEDCRKHAWVSPLLSTIRRSARSDPGLQAGGRD